MARNHFPPHYAENISETNLPAELIPQFTTVEYELQTNAVGPPVFLFVVDTCVDEDELAHLRDALQQTLNLLPEDALVGLITFGTLVNVHELGFADCPKSYVFRGEKEYAPQKVQDMLGVAPMRSGPQGPVGAAGGPAKQPALGRFLLPVAECTFALEQVLEDLQKDPWPCQADERVQRCTGTALSVGAITSVTGAIGFIGLVAPHLVRPFVGYSPRRVLLPATLAGALLLLCADIAARLVHTNPELRLGVFTSLLGTPFFFWLVVRIRKVAP